MSSNKMSSKKYVNYSSVEERNESIRVKRGKPKGKPVQRRIKIGTLGELTYLKEGRKETVTAIWGKLNVCRQIRTYSKIVGPGVTLVRTLPMYRILSFRPIIGVSEITGENVYAATIGFGTPTEYVLSRPKKRGSVKVEERVTVYAKTAAEARKKAGRGYVEGFTNVDLEV